MATLADYGVMTDGISPALSEELAAALMKAMDPELGMDMLNLGLVYALTRDETANYHLEMLLTTVGCPLMDYLERQLRHALRCVIDEVPLTVQFRLSPAWTPARMSRAAKLTLGIT